MLSRPQTAEQARTGATHQVGTLLLPEPIESV